MNTDQNGAVKPDIHSPFKDNADACKRLIRYHCFDQPVLSEKDLNKADEIFELTARHFIDKFSRMVDKYRCLLLKESMVKYTFLFYFNINLTFSLSFSCKVSFFMLVLCGILKTANLRFESFSFLHTPL